MRRKPLARAAGLALFFVCVGMTAPAHAAFAINLVLTGFTVSQQAAFASAKATWESLIIGYQPGITLTGININARGRFIDGAGGVLGSAGPTRGVIQGGFTLATDGIMEFDTADLSLLESSGLLVDVILHEMAHVFGFGTLWTNNGVYVNGTGRYTGVHALNAYRMEFDSAATFVPVELDGGPGTANGHWDELSIRDRQGRPLSRELMTGFLNPPTYISETTIQSFVDIGYRVRSLGMNAPEPATAGLLSIGLFSVSAVVVRRRSR